MHIRLFRKVRESWNRWSRLYDKFIELAGEDYYDIYPKEDNDEDIVICGEQDVPKHEREEEAEYGKSQ